MEKINQLTPRIILKELWKDLIFREIKAVKPKDQYIATYDYINDDGFNRSIEYPSTELAYKNIKSNEHGNIHGHYKDYFGFTTHRSFRNNDIHCNQEIFFSRKCYGELNLNGRFITGNFSMRRGFKSVPPDKKQYICGLVETGERGLFYRKWFVCSKEFLTLWTMICEPEHYSLKNKTDNEYVTKTLDELMKELDTSEYSIPYQDIDTEEKKRKYKSYNVENLALYIPNIYQKIARALFKPSKNNSDDLYQSYEDQIKFDLMWMK